MTLKDRLEFCTICENRKIDFKTGLVCNLTNQKPNFENFCEFFAKDEKEAERKLKMRLDGAGNSRSQNGSLNPQKNINYGSFLIVAGILIFLVSILFGAIVLFGGISFLIRGISQKKIMKENQLLNERINKR